MENELTIEALRDIVDNLQARVAAIEAQLVAQPATATRAPARMRERSDESIPAPDWAVPYEVTELVVGDTWIELHEPSARPQLHRLIIELVENEGPVTETYTLRRIREAWGVKRAGTRIQQVFEQALRQLSASKRIERRDGSVLHQIDGVVEEVRIPSGHESTKRAVDEIPTDELRLAIVRVVSENAPIAADDATARVSRMFGWTRRGTEIQSALDAALSSAVVSGAVVYGDHGLEPAELVEVS